MPDRKPGPSVKDDKIYEALRQEGASKQKAARITNSKGASRRGGESPRYEKWSKAQLYDRAREIGIEDRSKMSKKQLMHALRSN